MILKRRTIRVQRRPVVCPDEKTAAAITERVDEELDRLTEAFAKKSTPGIEERA